MVKVKDEAEWDGKNQEGERKGGTRDEVDIRTSRF